MAHEMGRKYIGFELDKSYYKKAQSRLNAITAQMNIFDYLG
jgi:DNA modification methylase